MTVPLHSLWENRSVGLPGLYIVGISESSNFIICHLTFSIGGKLIDPSNSPYTHLSTVVTITKQRLLSTYIHRK